LSIAGLPEQLGFRALKAELLRQPAAVRQERLRALAEWSTGRRPTSFPYDLFHWKGLDGSRVLAHTFENPIHGL